MCDRLLTIIAPRSEHHDKFCIENPSTLLLYWITSRIVLKKTVYVIKRTTFDIKNGPHGNMEKVLLKI